MAHHPRWPVPLSGCRARGSQVREGSEMILDLHTTATANAQKLGATAELWSFDEQSGQWRAEVGGENEGEGERRPRRKV